VVVPAAVNSTKPKLPHRLIQLQVILPKTICQPMLIQLQLNQPKQLISQLIQQQLICSWISHPINSCINQKQYASPCWFSCSWIDQNSCLPSWFNRSCFAVDSTIQSAAVETSSVCQLIYCWINWKPYVSPVDSTGFFNQKMIDSTAFRWQRCTPHLIKYCEDTHPEKQLQATHAQHSCLRRSIAGNHVLHVILLGVGGVVYISHTLVPLKSLGLELQRVKKIALKLRAHSVHYTHKLVQTRRSLEHSPHLQTNQERCAGSTIATKFVCPQPSWSLTDPPFLFWWGASLLKWPLFLHWCEELFLLLA